MTSSSNHDHQGSIEPRYGNLAYRGLPGGEESNPGLSLVGESILPAIAKQVTGWAYVEIGDQESFGFVVRALGYGGLDYEDDTPETLAEATTRSADNLPSGSCSPASTRTSTPTRSWASTSRRSSPPGR